MHSTSLTIHEILKKYWHYDNFRPLQEDIIKSAIKGNDTLALLPTGGGKSLCFQVPGMFLAGMTIVISPLIALMKDQVERLTSIGIAATYLNGSLPNYLIDRRLQEAMDGKYKFLYIAPERISSQMFLQRLERMQVSLLVVDEAHCISQWGYDFRPSYLTINKIREIKKNIPCIALTASATPEVQQDIIQQLHLQKVKVFTKSFRRDNLRYFVVDEENVMPRILEITKRTLGTGIIYVRTRKNTEKIATYLTENGISAIAYHGGKTHSDRDKIQQAWIENTQRIIVATNAFGMGIDKPDVRFVVHYELPADLESYYQEAGRGGRDGKTALAIAFRNKIDIAELNRWNEERYPTWEQLEQVYLALCNYFQVPNEGNADDIHPFLLNILTKELHINARTLHTSVQLLHREGMLFLNEDAEDYAYIQVTASPESILAFKKNQPKSALLTDMILRNMGGAVYQREVPFLPNVWGIALNWSVEELEQQLQRLVQLDLITYQPASGTPTIRLLKNRNALSKNAMNWQKYVFLREQSDFRLNKMLEYIGKKTVCRSLLIQQYFGEKDTQNCGKCDVCIGRNKEEVNDNEFLTIQTKLLAHIKKQPTHYREVLQNITVGTPAQREKVLRYLLDKEIILSDNRGNLKVK
jgi:ATP-dependent DNA helicase RecQ